MKGKRYKPVTTRKRQSWLPFGLIGLGVLALVVMLALSVNHAGSQAVIPPRVGAPLSDFALSDIHGQTVRMSDYAGQVVLVNSWATWCPPCKAEMPDLNTYYQAHRGEGFTVLAINAGDPETTVAEFAQGIRLTFPILLDPNTQVLDGFGIQGFPTSIVVGRDGRVKMIHVGMYSPEDLEAEVTPLLVQ
jgi:peroxiredoxin